MDRDTVAQAPKTSLDRKRSAHIASYLGTFRNNKATFSETKYFEAFDNAKTVFA